MRAGLEIDLGRTPVNIVVRLDNEEKRELMLSIRLSVRDRSAYAATAGGIELKNGMKVEKKNGLLKVLIKVQYLIEDSYRTPYPPPIKSVANMLRFGSDSQG